MFEVQNLRVEVLSYRAAIIGILTHRSFKMKLLLAVVLIFLPVVSFAQELLIEASIEVGVGGYSAYNHVSLTVMHPALAKGVKNTRLSSATLDFPITHYIQAGVLKYFMPSETELSGDYVYEIVATEIVVDEDGKVKKKFIRHGGIPEINMCRIKHPMLFEGETLDGQPFKIYILLAGGSRIPCGFHSGSEMEATNDFFLDMKPYLVLTRDNSVKIRFPGAQVPLVLK
jgi:hypothetical protein